MQSLHTKVRASYDAFGNRSQQHGEWRWLWMTVERAITINENI